MPPHEDEKEDAAIARIDRESAAADDWIQTVVDVVFELEGLLAAPDGHAADADEEETKSSRRGGPASAPCVRGRDPRARAGTSAKTSRSSSGARTTRSTAAATSIRSRRRPSTPSFEQGPPITSI